ncbi:hypothetical protein [Pimelobacter simplex]|uniref:hypothetical protein n=1 Tax=Nocardioides simplex TaxID=2045 RepID=UPI0021504947|nr:hypothetical protein [Pimelobacter simplex]UUW90305.1 hypothetical protein M0M43_02125 [Pimelobacter simplex]UUW94135.1 hypothetical protein M0M48_20640 [Pimelobacter simplex]
MSLPPGREMAQVLITVKTYPAPSARHGETVCIAGVRLYDDGRAPTFIRLYPVPFRMLEDSGQFAKYQIVDAPVRSRGSRDPRPESYEPDVDGFVLGERIDTKRKWARRTALIEPLIGATTTCELIARNRAGAMNQAIESFGLIKPTIRSMEVLVGTPWTPRQLEKVRAATEPSLFNQNGLVELQPPPFRIKFSYLCQESGCRGHNQELIDWELGAAGYAWPRRYGDDTAAMIEQKWSEITDSTKKDIHFYVGNQHQRRAAFSVCGLWSPPL